MNIIKRQIAYNRTKRTSAIKYIVIHDTGNKKKGADAMAHYNYFNGGDRQSSADFFVDDKSVVQINDYKKYYTWAVGDGKGKYGITNSNSVSIEICVNEDGNYKEAYLKAVELTKILMAELNIPADRVVRHYDASRKKCPASMSSGNWAYWQDFKNRLSKNSEDLTTTQAVKELTTPNDIVWELGYRGIVEDTEGMLKEMNKYPNGRLYWLARKMLHYIRTRESGYKP
jgi:N-acetylmuramoyl-L-alanine amidase